jgi:hypothetical protein
VDEIVGFSLFNWHHAKRMRFGQNKISLSTFFVKGVILQKFIGRVRSLVEGFFNIDGIFS